ncbi:U4 U6.U5 tri-snRNP-associated protein [Coemansia sp. BCRC 34301]|nr:U4 U6.U5 tri-snRNP-associated protein [Coemansia sp. BCRC 34301]
MATPLKRPATEEEGDALTPVKIRRTGSRPSSSRENASDNDNSLSAAELELELELPAPDIEGLYLDTVNRVNLDFDFEQLCSVSLSNNNIYACLVCGKYYQGRGKQTHAYFHSINEDHHVFINLRTLRIYVLPDNYEVDDKSLNDIKAAVRPTYSVERVALLDATCDSAYDLGGKRYIPGLVGLNRIKCNDYMNVVVQALAHVPPIRDAMLLLSDLEHKSPLVQRMASLVRKMWHPKLLKSHISPHELHQEISNRSNRHFKLDSPGDAFDLLTWLLNTLHIDLGGSRKTSSSIVYQTFRGELSVAAQQLQDTRVRSREDDPIIMDDDKLVTRTKHPFLTLSLELPPRPLFADDNDDDKGEVGIPQVALASLLQRYGGSMVVERQGQAKHYQLLKLPQFIICHIKRFTKTELATEKNPTVVNFPIHNVPFGSLLPKDVPTHGSRDISATYSLIVNICHDGQPLPLAGAGNKASTESGQSSAAASTAATYTSDETAAAKSQYLVYVHHAANDKWYMMRDLQVEPVMPQMIFLSDSYVQIWQRNGSE